ncbi:MAG: molybdenum cofactor biosynthesis protein B [Halanaerobiales bacterium]
MIRVAVLFISDEESADKESAGSNSLEEIISELLTKINGRKVYYSVVREDFRQIQEALFNVTEKGFADLILTIGGTGFARKNVTPEATLAVVEKEVPGITEFMRMKTASKYPSVILSRGRAGIRKTSLIINLPDVKEEVVESIDCLAQIIPEGISILRKDHDYYGYKELRLWN